MPADMAAVVDDDVEPAQLPVDPRQQRRIVLAALVDPDPVGGVGALVMEIQRRDTRQRKVIAPHLQRRAAGAGILVAADADFQEPDRAVAQMRELPRILGGVAVRLPLVAAMAQRQRGQGVHLTVSGR